MNNYDINSAWASVVPILRKFRFNDIREIVGLVGFDMLILKDLGIDNNVWDKQNPSLLVYEIGDHFLDFTNEKKHRFLNFVIEAVLRQLAFLKLLISNLAKLNGKNQILASSRTI